MNPSITPPPTEPKISELVYSVQQALDHCLQPPHCGHADYLARPILGLPGQLRELEKSIDALRAWGVEWRIHAEFRQALIEEYKERNQGLLPLIEAVQDWRDAGEEVAKARLDFARDACSMNFVWAAEERDKTAQATLAAVINSLTGKGLL